MHNSRQTLSQSACFRRGLCLGLALTIFAILPSLRGQDRPPPPAKGVAVQPKQRDFTKMSPQQRQWYLSAQRGAEWLQRANKPDGRFVYGLIPALRMPMEEDSFLAQTEAVFALARAGRFFGNEQAITTARVALLSLLLETAVDGKQPPLRRTIPPSVLVNRAAAAGRLVLAIHELPAPADDLLEQGDQLCRFLMTQLQSDGSLLLTDNNARATAEVVEQHSGPALHGLIRSQSLRPAEWKLDALRKARAFYHGWWLKHKNLPMIAGHTAACAEAFRLTRDRDFAEFVFAMNDWLCTLQYRDLDIRRQSWLGGFMPQVDGKSASLPPDVRTSAQAAQSLADAYLMAVNAADLPRQKRYQEALESCLQFLTTLQYTDGNCQHFAEWFRPMVVGGFYASARDGNLRLDDSAQTVSAFVQYLQQQLGP